MRIRRNWAVTLSNLSRTGECLRGILWVDSWAGVCDNMEELGLGGWERVASIFAFNIGISAMQPIVVLTTLPSLILLSRSRAYSAFRIAGALFARLASAGWIAERLFNQ
jgi:hypothetical protein